MTLLDTASLEQFQLAYWSKFLSGSVDDKIVLGLEYIWLAPGFVKEVLEVYEAWEGKEAVPMKVKELMMVLQIEVSRRYKVEVRPQYIEISKDPELKDTKLN